MSQPGPPGDEESIQKILKELSRAIHDSLTASSRIAGCVERLRETGFDLYLILEATVALKKIDEEGVSHGDEMPTRREEIQRLAAPSSAATSQTCDDGFNGPDLEFLKDLRIKPV